MNLFCDAEDAEKLTGENILDLIKYFLEMVYRFLGIRTGTIRIYLDRGDPL